MRLFAVTFSFFCIYFLQAAEARVHGHLTSAGAQVQHAKQCLADGAGDAPGAKSQFFPVISSEIIVFRPILLVFDSPESSFSFINAKNFCIQSGLSPPNATVVQI